MKYFTMTQIKYYRKRIMLSSTIVSKRDLELTFAIVGTAVQARGLVHVRLGQRRRQLFQAKLFGSRKRRHAPKLYV